MYKYVSIYHQLKELKDNYTKEDYTTIREISQFTREYFHNYLNSSELENKDEKAREDGHFPYIPSSPEFLIESVSKVLYLMKVKDNFSDIKFIDCGSGNGDKAFLAHWLFGLNSTGLEYTLQTHLLSIFLVEKLLDKPILIINDKINTERNSWIPSNTNTKMKFIKGDGMVFDFSPYDIIYTYQPIADNKGLKKLYENIFNTMKIGAYWIEASPHMRCPYYHSKESGSFFSDYRHQNHHIIKKIGKDKVYGYRVTKFT